MDIPFNETLSEDELVASVLHGLFIIFYASATVSMQPARIITIGVIV